MKKIFALGAILTILLACQKELSRSNAGKDEPTVSNFLKEKAAIPLVTTANSAQSITITGKKWTKIYFPANAFVRKDGTAVTGNVTIAFTEIYNAADMIFNRKPTVSNGRLLESGGEFLVHVTQAGNELQLAPGALMRVEINRDSTNVTMGNMAVFNGKAASDTGINWQPATTPGNAVVQNIDSVRGFVRYYMFTDSVEWINCDRYVNEPSIIYHVDGSSSPSPDSLQVYVHFTNRNSILNLYSTDKPGVFDSYNLIAAPVTLIGITAKGKQLYAAFSSVTLSNNGSSTLNFTAMTKEEIEAKLRTLK